jgi:hypothetical protein
MCTSRFAVPSTRSTYVLSPFLNCANNFLSDSQDGIQIYIGKPPRTQMVYIPHETLGAFSVLHDRLSEGVTILNTDPEIFKIVMEHVEYTGLLAILQSGLYSSLGHLVNGSNMLLNLAMAWHLAHMLELPRLQNQLIDTFSVCYRRFTYRYIQIPLCAKPFQYLREHMGSHTKCEKFLVDFYAGLANSGRSFRREELMHLPQDIARELQARRIDLIVSFTASDRILRSRQNCFHITFPDNTQRVTLQVLPASASHVPMTSLHGRYRSYRSTPSIGTLTRPGPTEYSHGHHSGLSLPTTASIENHEHQARLRMYLAGLDNPASTRTPLQSQLASAAARAPFMPLSPSQERRLRLLQMEDSSSSSEDDEESADDSSMSQDPEEDHLPHRGPIASFFFGLLSRSWFFRSPPIT